MTAVNENLHLMLKEEPSETFQEFQAGVDVLSSVLETSPETTNTSLTPCQRDGLRKLRKVILATLTIATQSMVKKETDDKPTISKIAVPKKTLEKKEPSSSSLIPKKLFESQGQNPDSDDTTNQYLLSEFGGIKPTNSRWGVVKNAVKATMILNRMKAFSSSRNMLMKEKVKDLIYTPPEWYDLDQETQTQLTSHLSWESLMKWDFDMFEISKLCRGKPLLFVGWAILASPHSQRIMEETSKSELKNDNEKSAAATTNNREGYRFLEKFDIAPKCMVDFLRAIEDKYLHENPYHNNIHAADVLQTTHSFLKGMGVDFLGRNGTKSSLPSSLTLHAFSLLIGAAVHDVAHPGFNNNFLSKSFSHLALTYNDTSVLENHHVSVAFQMILGNNGNSDLNIFKGMDPDEFIKCRRFITEAVVGTDMVLHFGKLDEIKRLLPIKTPLNDELSKDEKFMSHSWKIMKFMMHVADISNLAKRNSVSVQWTNRVLEEFFLQGDKENELGLPISPLCDRNTTSRPNSQMGFIDFIIRPAFEVLQQYFKSIGTKALPFIEENYEFWKFELQQEKEIGKHNIESYNDENSIEGEEEVEVCNTIATTAA